jgi:hypothetical protein
LPWQAVTGGVTSADSVGLAAWIVARDAAFAACTQGKSARQTHDIYEVRFAAWLASLEADDSEDPNVVAYEAAVAAAGTILAGVASDVWDSLVVLLGDLCAA